MKKRLIITTLCLIALLSSYSKAFAVELQASDVHNIMLHEGKYVTVKGKVVSTHAAKSGKVRFLNFGDDYKKAFTVVIFTGDLQNFISKVGEPVDYYLNKKIKVTGKIKIYQNKPEIIANDPKQIIVVE
jgi:DNA/RNA endonuclease YhcR with UshA esterase domain